MEQWAVPKGTERRVFLTGWMALCVALGVTNVLNAWAALQTRPSVGSWALVVYHALYIVNLGGLGLLMALRPATYRRYKVLLDESHLHHCQVGHVLEAFFPPTGAPKPPGWLMMHAGALIGNPLLYNLPLESTFRVMATVLPSHALMLWPSVRHALGPAAMSWGQWLAHVAAMLVLSPAAALAFTLFLGRTDMPPPGAAQRQAAQAPAAAAGLAAAPLLQRSASLGPAAAQQRPPRPARLGPVQQAMVLVHDAQVYTQLHLRHFVVFCTGAAVLAQVLRCTLLVARSHYITTHMTAELVLLACAYSLGSYDVLAQVQPKLSGALTLLYDLVPQHIAEALMEQDHSGSSSDASRRPSPTGQVATHLVTPAAAAAGGLTRAESISPSAQGAVAAANGKPQLNGLRQAAAASPPEPGGQPHRAAQGQPSPLGRSATLQAQALAGVGGGGTDAARSPDLLADAGAPAAPDQRPEGAATDLQMQGAQGPMVEPVLASAASQLQGSARARRGSWYTTSTLSRAMSSFKETMTEAQVPSLKLREGGDAAAAAPSGGQVVQVPEALTLDGHVSRTPQIASWHEHTSIFFCDIESFTDCCQAVQPAETMAMLNELFFRIDGLCMGESRVTKIETVGDCVMAATGLLHDDPDHAITMLEFAAALQHEAGQVLYPHNGRPLRVRVGIHSGRVMSGVVGRIRKRYCLFGDTVNTASRMESNGQPGRIHVSQATYDLVMASPRRDEWRFECRGEIPIKGKGLMVTYWAERAGPA